MKITKETATTLGQKLSGVELTDEEGMLLATLLSSGDDVSGFGRAKPAESFSLNFEEIKVTFAPAVIRPLPGKWKIEEGESYTEVEWTY